MVRKNIPGMRLRPDGVYEKQLVINGKRVSFHPKTLMKCGKRLRHIMLKRKRDRYLNSCKPLPRKGEPDEVGNTALIYSVYQKKPSPFWRKAHQNGFARMTSACFLQHVLGQRV